MEIALRKLNLHHESVKRVSESRHSQLLVETKEPSEAERREYAIVVQCTARRRRARAEMARARHFWAHLNGNVQLQGPALPLSKNLILSLGVSLWGFYSGHSITLQVGNDMIETRTISR